ncbi:MAG: hypothetical protein ABIL91_08010 [candidate division WOR-3 bacterium]
MAKFLINKRIPFKYEYEICGYFPDFLIKDSILIEVVGLEWKPRLEKVRLKFRELIKLGYEIIVFTYPNMVKYFNDLPVKIVTNLRELNDILGI